VQPLPRGERPSASLLVPVLVAAGWWAVLAMADTLATARSLVFLGGPLLLLAGLHARLFAYLHAPERLTLLPLPIDPLRHHDEALRRHRPALAVTLVLGIVAIVAAVLSGGGSWWRGLGLAGEFAWLGVVAWLLEPAIAGASAWLGRRFPAGSRGHELQRSLGGGWTTPEAVIHLYAPALGLALAAALAMPGQLGLERWLDAGALAGNHVLLALVPLVVALALRVASPRFYAAGVWEAVPWLAEATRTIAGPPRPEPSPAWLRMFDDPWLRLTLVQFLRLTPLPMLRLGGLLGFGAYLVVRDAPLGGPSVAALLALVGLWWVPGRIVRQQAAVRARMAAALPLPASRRGGEVGPGVALFAAPVVVVGIAVGARALFFP
jgi:hypothetical protein